MRKKRREDNTDAERPWLTLRWNVSWLVVQELMKERRT